MLQALLSLVYVALNTFFFYVFIIFALSLAGKRQRSEISGIELVVIAVLGSSVETGMVAGDKTLLAGLVSVVTLLASNRLLSYLMQHWDWLRRIVVGRPIPLVYRGKLLTKRMREAGLDEDDIFEGIHEQGYEDLKQVRLAMLEIDGDISVVPEEEGRKQ